MLPIIADLGNKPSSHRACSVPNLSSKMSQMRPPTFSDAESSACRRQRAIPYVCIEIRR